MINPILFRGGMYGDLLLGMIDPTALINTKKFTLEYKHSRCADKYIKYTRTFMKKFFMYTVKQKENRRIFNDGSGYESKANQNR